jgi:branched-subunit amino acid aminotransferase/4-amino-4-deoxychorismate lyase
VLAGSVRALVLAAARQRGVRVVERAPRVAERAEFDAAFVTNAVQILTPVRCIRFPTLPECEGELALPRSEAAAAVVDTLRSVVWRALDEGSTSMALPVP